MYSGLHISKPKTPVVKRLAAGCQKVAKGLSEGCQNRGVSGLKKSLSRRLRDGVFSLTACGYPQCRCCHITASAHNADVRSFCQ